MNHEINDNFNLFLWKKLDNLNELDWKKIIMASANNKN